LLSELSKATADVNCVIGCTVLGRLLSMVTTCDGNSARSAQVLDTHLTCSGVGISPVINSQNNPSGRGSLPPGALGNNF